MSMRASSRLLFYLLLFSGMLLSGTLFGQQKLNLTAGAGTLEKYYLGVNYMLGEWQFGLTAGGNERPYSSSRSAGLSASYHFFGRTKLNTQRSWYLSASMNYLNQKMDYFEYDRFFFNARLGRIFNFSNRFGLALEAGKLFDIGSTVAFNYNKYPYEFMCGSDSRFSTEYHILSLSAKLVYRIY